MKKEKGDINNKTHHIHIEEIDSTSWLNQILFRDYLRLNEDIREQYAELKKNLAQEYANDRETYTTKKVDFILDIIEKSKKYFLEYGEN